MRKESLTNPNFTNNAQIRRCLLSDAARFARHAILRFIVFIAVALCTTSAYALTVTYGGMNRLTDPNAYANGSAWYAGLPLGQPGNKAFIDDQFINVFLSHGTQVPGDRFGTRTTDPNGNVIEHVLTMGADGCWRRLFFSHCSGFGPGSWVFGTGVYMGALGQWKLEVVSNGAGVAGDYFTLSPYMLNENSGNNQSISLLSITPKPLQIKLIDPAGGPASDKAVTFTVTSAPKGMKTDRLSATSSYTGTGTTTYQATTDANGLARVYLQSASKTGSYTVAATSSLAPGKTVNFTVKVRYATSAYDIHGVA